MEWNEECQDASPDRELAEQVVTGALDLSSLSCGASAVLFSGASPGADTLFGHFALLCGHRVVHWLGPLNEPSDEAQACQAQCLHKVPDTVLDADIITQAVRRAATAIGGHCHSLDEENTDAARGELDQWKDSRRNFLQVCRAEVEGKLCAF